MALGASSGKVASDVVRQALVLASVGCAAGAAAGFFGTRLLGSLLYGVSPSDPATFATVIAAAALTSVLAAWFPARRAGRVDPILALKT